jgi:hypothetical protein
VPTKGAPTFTEKTRPGKEGPINLIEHMEVEFMLPRSHKRLPLGYRAELVAYNVTYEAFVENISEHGMSLKIVQISTDHTFEYISDVALKIHPTFGKRIVLSGRKKWSSKNSPNSIIESIGIEIINPPPEYKELYQGVSLQ